jgi:hypothetical protein
MLQSEQIELLDKLRFSDRASERNLALRDLKRLELEGTFEADDLVRLLDEKDFVFQTYAIGAIGRLKIEKGIPALCKLYQTSNDPLILPALLETFAGFQSDAFVACVVGKFNQLLKNMDRDQTGNQAFLLEQIIVPALKYLQVSGGKKIAETISCFLNNSDATIRWHALMTYEKLELPITEEELQKIVQSDSYALVREQASVMLEKRRRKKTV